MKDPLAYVNSIKEILNETDNNETDNSVPTSYGFDFMAKKSVGPKSGNTLGELKDAVIEKLVPDIGISYNSPSGFSMGVGPTIGKGKKSINFGFRKEFDDGGIATPKRGLVDGPGSYSKPQKIGGEVLKEAGGIPVTLPGGELFTALQTGVIDATEWVGPYNDLTFGFHQAAKYYYYPGWHEPGPMLELLINIDAWNSLPKHLQVIIETATKAVNQDTLDEYLARNNKALTELIEVHGVELRKLPDDVIEEFRVISNEILSNLAKEDEVIGRVYDSYIEFKNNVSEYHQISEDAFIEARNIK